MTSTREHRKRFLFYWSRGWLRGLQPSHSNSIQPGGWCHSLDGLNVPELRSAMLAADAELRAGGVGEPLIAESFATILSVHLIRHTTGAHRLPVSADGVLSRRKLRTVVEYIMENLEGSPTLQQMAAVAHLSSSVSLWRTGLDP